MKKNSPKKVTLESISQLMRAGFEGVRKHTDTQVEGLARMVQGGFKNSHTELTDLRKEMNERFRVVTEEFQRVNANTSDLSRSLGPLMQIAGQQNSELRDLQMRMKRMERRVGIVR